MESRAVTAWDLIGPFFYSNVAAPRIRKMFEEAGSLIASDVEAASKDKIVKAAVTDKHIARRLEMPRDLVTVETTVA